MNDWDVSGDENDEEKSDVDDLDLDDLDDIDVTGGAWGDDNDSDLDLDDDLDAADEKNNEEGKQDGSNKDGVFVAPSAANRIPSTGRAQILPSIMSVLENLTVRWIFSIVRSVS